MTRPFAIPVFVCASLIGANGDAFEVRVRAEARLDVDVSAAGTVAQASGTLRDDLGRGLPQRELTVQIDARSTGQTLVSRDVYTDARGQFAVNDELPPGEYEVFVRFDKTEHLDATAVSASLRLEPLPITTRVVGPSFVYGRERPAWVSGRASAGRTPYQGSADVFVNGVEVGVMPLDTSGRGTFDVVNFLKDGTNTVTVKTAGSAYRDGSEASLELRFATAVQIEATIEERLERLSRGIAVVGTVADAAGPLGGVRVETTFEPLVAYDEADMTSGAESKSLLSVTTITDDRGRFVGFLPAEKVFDGRWRGVARFVPPVGEPVQASAGTLDLDSRAYRWAVNGFGLTAIFAGLLALLGRIGLVLRERWSEWRANRARALRDREALQEVETIKPVYLSEEELGSDLPMSRNDVGGMVWDVWRSRPIPDARLELARGDKKHTATVDASGRFRFANLEDGVWRLSVERHGFMPGLMDIDIPHDGRLSRFRLDTIAVPLKIRKLYGTVLESRVGADLWGSLSPRQIETRLDAVLSDVSVEERLRLRAAVLDRLGADSERVFEGPEVVAALTEVVEEAYFSGREYGEGAFRLARALAVELRERGPEAT